MFFKKKKNPNSDAFASTAPAQPTPQPQSQPQPQPQPQQNKSSDEEMTVSQLIEFLPHAKDNSLKAKTYVLLAIYHHDGTNGAVKDLEKAVFYAEKAVECDEDNNATHFYLGSYLLHKALAANNNDDIIKAIFRLILAHSKGNKDAYDVLGDVAKGNLFKNVSTADELINLFLNAIKK